MTDKLTRRKLPVRWTILAGLMVMISGCPSSDERTDDAKSPAAGEKTKTPPASTHRQGVEPGVEPGAAEERAKFTLVITGRLEGYMEPCGCAGLENMKGGMGRRHSLFKKLRQEKDWPVIGIDVGGMAKGYGRQAEIKFHRMADGLKQMGYDAIGLGMTDLRLNALELVSDVAKPSAFLSANVTLFGDETLTEKTRIVEAAGVKVGITGVLGNQAQRAINNPDVGVVDAIAALEKLVPELNNQADFLVLLAYATVKETAELAERFPNFDLIVTAAGGDVPPGKAAVIEGSKSLLVEVGQKGMHAIVLDILATNPQKPVPHRYHRVPLDAQLADSPEMKMLMGVYQEELQRLGFRELGIPTGDRAPPHPQKETLGKFVGSKKCMDCHETSYYIWKKTGHAKAFDTLVKLDPPRQFDPECISCHVIGWHPTKYFPYEGGYESFDGDEARGLAKTPHLIDVGCESCHGPGGAHVAAEMGFDEALQWGMQKAMVVTQEEVQDHASDKYCRCCHDLDNSPEFDFATYWPKVEHYEDEDDE